ncbi:trigger factor [Chloroflexota bacterium]
MKVSVQTIPGCQVVLNIEAEAEEMEGSLEAAYRRLVSRVDIPGFRRGKAPRAMLERYLRKDVLVDEAVEYLMPELYAQALKERGVETVAKPNIEIKESNPLSFTATTPLRPRVELGDYHQLSLPLHPVTVSDEEIDEALEHLRCIKSPWEAAARVVRFGDLVTLDVEGRAGDRVILDRKGVLYELVPNSSQPAPGFATELEGMSAGEEKEFVLTLSAESGELAGQECRFRVLVSGIKEKRLLDLDDEFAKGVSPDAGTLAQLRENIARQVRETKEKKATEELGQAAVKAVVGLAQVDYPEVLVEQEVGRLLAAQGANEVDTAQETEGDVRERLTPLARDRVLRTLVVEKLAELEQVEVSSEEIDTELDRLAAAAADPGALRRVLSSPSVRESLRSGLIARKAVDRLVDIATGAVVRTDEGGSPAVDNAEGEVEGAGQ